MSWECNCGLINAGGLESPSRACAGINQVTIGLADSEHYQISPSKLDSVLYWTRNRRMKELTENEEKFAQFFNAESVLVSAMSEIELVEHIQELEEIAFEAKARLTAAKTKSRDNSAKKRLGGEWSISPTQPDQTVTDTINRVKLRANRMTKLDKMRAKLSALGLEEKEIDSMINKMLTQARKDKPAAMPINGDELTKAVTEPKSTSPFNMSPKPSGTIIDLSKLNIIKK